MTTAGGASAVTLAEREQHFLATAAEYLDRHAPAFLTYSGGAESSLLRHLLSPYRDRLTLVWVNAASLPHQAEWVRRHAEGWRFVELVSDPYAFFRVAGVPSRLVPTPATLAGRVDPPTPPTTPAIISNLACCFEVRGAPVHRWAIAAGMALEIHGQRRGENSGAFLPNTAPFATWGPLARWTRAEVLEPQFCEGVPQSFECGICPADVTPARMAFLRRHYPATYAEATRLRRPIIKAIEAEAVAYRRAELEALAQS
jgi:3'-phosphoadenosine 5'-phosphosulfate sulfotransferase (PAPS reductase)/FAD synthetase